MIALSNFVHWKRNSLTLSVPIWAVWLPRIDAYSLLMVPNELGAASGLAPYLSSFFW